MRITEQSKFISKKFLTENKRDDKMTPNFEQISLLPKWTGDVYLVGFCQNLTRGCIVLQNFLTDSYKINIRLTRFLQDKHSSYKVLIR